MIYGNISRAQAIEFAKNKTILFAIPCYPAHIIEKLDDNELRSKMRKGITKCMLVDPSPILGPIKCVKLNRLNQPIKSGQVNYEARAYTDTWSEAAQLVSDCVDSIAEIDFRQIIANFKED